MHARRHCTDKITTILRPLSLLVVAEFHNVLKVYGQGQTSLDKLFGAQSDVGMNVFHNWGWPVYVLDFRLQYGKGNIPK